MLTEEQEQQVIDMVSTGNIKNRRLRDDLIDHLCCLTEINMGQGQEFEKAYEKALKQTAPNGLEEIQRETIFLLNYSKIMFMKRFTYVMGYLFTLIWVAGVLMKILHFAGAAMLMGVGAIGVVCIFIPLLLINRYKIIAREVLSERMKWIFGFISIVLLVVSTTLRYLHIPGAYSLTALSALTFAFGFLPFFFFRMYKKSAEEL